MIKNWKLFCLVLMYSLGLAISARVQALKKVTPADVFKNGTFTQKLVSGINWTKDGQFYSSLVQRSGAPAVVKINLASGVEAGV